MADQLFRKYWRLYRTGSGNRIVQDELNELDTHTRAEFTAAMKEVVVLGIRETSKSIRGDIRQIEADGPDGTTYRLLFAQDGHVGQILLAVVLFEKRTQKTPDRQIELAEVRLEDWRRRRKATDKVRAEVARRAGRRQGACRPVARGVDA